MTLTMYRLKGMDAEKLAVVKAEAKALGFRANTHPAKYATGSVNILPPKGRIFTEAEYQSVRTLLEKHGLMPSQAYIWNGPNAYIVYQSGVSFIRELA